MDPLKSRGYVHRHAFLIQCVRGKRILDVGVVGETCSDELSRVEAFDRSLHWKLASVAREAVGIDYAEDVVASLRRAYPDLTLVAGDVYEARSLFRGSTRFEVVILGDILEHLANPGLVLDEVRPLLEPGGELIVSTPNAFGLPNFVRHIAGRFQEGDDHVLSFNKFTLAHLLERHGFTVTTVRTCLDRDPRSRRTRRRYALATGVLRHLPELGGTLLVTAVADR